MPAKDRPPSFRMHRAVQEVAAEWTEPTPEAEAPHADYIARMLAYRADLKSNMDALKARWAAEAGPRKRGPRKPKPEAPPRPPGQAALGRQDHGGRRSVDPPPPRLGREPEPPGQGVRHPRPLHQPHRVAPSLGSRPRLTRATNNPNHQPRNHHDRRHHL